MSQVVFAVSILRPTLLIERNATFLAVANVLNWPFSDADMSCIIVQMAGDVEDLRRMIGVAGRHPGDDVDQAANRRTGATA